ncbi:MAG: aldose epimerase family protein [Mangrovibacterium sp.]
MMQLITLRNTHGLKAVITNYGGRVVSMFAPDRNGRFEDLVLGYDKPEDYLHSNEKYYGALIGRYGNRIGKARFRIGNQMYFLERNNGENSLHGGNGGFHNVCWVARQVNDGTLELEYVSNDMEEGFPGTLAVRVIYCLTDNNDLKIEYFASTDKPTVVNLTHHSFFNLTGDPSKTINNHILQIPAAFYTPVDEGLIPTGEIASVEGTPFDFRTPTAIGERLGKNHDQLKFGGGYDHNWVLDAREDKGPLKMVAKVVDPESGRVMTVYTNEPGIQFYGGNFLDGKDTGKGGIAYGHRTAFCLETQHFPDSPNKDNFPPVLLQPGEEYYSICLYHFDHE